jgi:hypothetical protein
MKILKQKIKFSDLPKEEQKSEIESEALSWKETFKDEEEWKNCTDKEYRECAKTRLIEDEWIEERKYSLIEFKNGIRKWVFDADAYYEIENN